MTALATHGLLMVSKMSPVVGAEQARIVSTIGSNVHKEPEYELLVGVAG